MCPLNFILETECFDVKESNKNRGRVGRREEERKKELGREGKRKGEIR